MWPFAVLRYHGHSYLGHRLVFDRPESGTLVCYLEIRDYMFKQPQSSNKAPKLLGGKRFLRDRRSSRRRSWLSVIMEASVCVVSKAWLWEEALLSPPSGGYDIGKGGKFG